MSGPFGSSQWMYASGGFYNGVATQSLRFDDGSSAYLSRTPSSAGNQKTWTFSSWIKPSNITIDRNIFTRHDSGSDTFVFRLDQNDDLQVENYSSGAYQLHLVTDAKFRDSSAWYHVVLSLDTTQGTASNRAKLYVNGVQQTSFSSSTYPSQNADLKVNAATIHRIGARAPDNYFDGYMSEVNFVDGSALDPTSFGETKNGVWIAKRYTGSYGTNGFRLQFNQTGTGSASSSTIGADTSGNDNHWTSSGIVASDCSLFDSPENNWCTLNPLFATGVTNTFSEGNLKVATNSSGRPSIASSFVMPTGTGKWFFEARVSGDGGGVGIMRTDAPYNNDYYYGDYQWSIYSHSVIHNGASVGSLTGSATYPEVYGLMLDTDTDTLKVYVGGSEVGSFSVDAGYDYYPISGDGSGAISITNQFNFGQDSTFQGDEIAGGNVDANGLGDFSMTVPTDAKSLCTANLPEPTISPNADTQADDYFSPTLYTSNNIGAGGTQSVTGVGFQPDWVWIKNRSSSGTSNTLFDTVRTAGKMLQSDNATAEASNSQYGYLSSFDSDGFTLTGGTTNANFINQGTDAYVSWNWKAGGTAVSNTDGSITSSVSANTDAGFSIVTFTGNKTRGATIGHGLGVKPDMIIMKNRQLGVSWVVWFPNLQANNQLLELNSTGAVLTNTGDPNAWWNNTAPTSSVITLGDYDGINDDLNMVAYCFAEIEGYSKFGSYTGNGSTDGTFIYTGFRPAWVMMKNTTTSGNSWVIQDKARSTYNEVNAYLLANDNGAEGTGVPLDFLSNGFKMTSASQNDSGANFIYMAFAENPFKYANAR
jgi:hypothetical protein